MTPVLSIFDLAVAASFVLINGAITTLLALGIARSLFLSAARMVIQLTLLAFVLRWLFAFEALLVTVIGILIMGVFAGLEVVLRQEKAVGRFGTGAVASSIILAAVFIVTMPTLILLIAADPWYRPQVALPIFGIVAGNAMTGIALTLSSFTDALERDAALVEARLALGETRTQALGDVLRQSVKIGLMPTINAMAAIGLVTFPGIMTGQLLANADPLQAAKYQMLVMFMIAGSSSLAIFAAAYAMLYRITDARHRLRLDRLQ
ncbi:MAG: ABC transporter permease [Pseudomonadota bacterium]